jgi:hypothetical protein
LPDEIRRAANFDLNALYATLVFVRHVFVLSQLLASPIVVIRGKAYVGGSRIDDAHGNLVDFSASGSG